MNMPEVAHHLANANYRREPQLRWLQLGLIEFDFLDDLRAEAEHIINFLPPSDVTTGKHVTNWTKPEGEVRQWSLLNRSGLTNDTSSDFDYKNLEKKKVTPGAVAIQHLVVNSIPDIVNLRLNALGPDSRLSPHEEHIPRKIGKDQVGIRARFHIPLFTNPRAWMLANNQTAHFEAGFLYLFNNGCVHAAGNDSEDEWRYHLVFDCLLTERLYRVLLEPEDSEPPRWLVPDVEKVPVTDFHLVTEWEKSGGMGVEEFDRREFGWCPNTGKEVTT